jgi:hypothetical protein
MSSIRTRWICQQDLAVAVESLFPVPGSRARTFPESTEHEHPLLAKATQKAKKREAAAKKPPQT